MKLFCLGFACGALVIVAAVFCLAARQAHAAPVKVACLRSMT